MNSFRAISQWQEKCGNSQPVVGSDQYWSMLNDQADRIREELIELEDAIDQKDLLEVVDAVADLDVTVAGAAFIHGGDHDGAMIEVLGNNDLKVTMFAQEADKWQDYYKDQGVTTYVCVARIENTWWYCVKRKSDNKIMKPPAFPKVDLTDFLPTIGE